MTMKNGQWTIKETWQIFKNDFFEVSEDEVIQPDGKDGKYAVVEFKQGAAVLPVDDADNVYLTKQFRYAIEREDLEVVAGVVEDEDFLAAAKRELREELGITAADWSGCGKIQSNTSGTRCTTHLFFARRLSFGKPQREATEQIETIKMKLADALEKVLNGEITHDQTCVLILKFYLKNQTDK